MRCNRKALFAIPLFVLALVLLRQGIVVATGEMSTLERQAKLMRQQDIDPAALFYTDSRVALQAIRHTNQRINND